MTGGYSHKELLPSGAKQAYQNQQNLNGGNFNFYQPAQLPPRAHRKRPGTAGRKQKAPSTKQQAVNIYGSGQVPLSAKSVALE